MKIERVTVEEYLNPHGVYAQPRLRVDLDTMTLPAPVEVHEQATIETDKLITVSGLKYSFLADMWTNHDLDGGVGLNTCFPGKPWFQVTVNFHEPEFAWWLPLDRARKELAKYQQDWTLVVDEEYAKAGFIVWRLRERDLVCKARAEWAKSGDYPFCNDPATTEIRRQPGYYIPLCSKHHQQLTADTIRRRGGKR